MEGAREGELAIEGLENTFRDYGETLGNIEAEVLELEPVSDGENTESEEEEEENF